MIEWSRCKSWQPGLMSQYFEYIHDINFLEVTKARSSIQEYILFHFVCVSIYINVFVFMCNVCEFCVHGVERSHLITWNFRYNTDDCESPFVF